MLRARLLTAAGALPLLIVLIGYAPEWGFSSAILVLTGVGLWEYFSLTRAQCTLSPLIGKLWGLLVALSMVSGDMRLIGTALSLGFMLIFILSLRDRYPARGIQTTSLFVLGVVYIGFFFRTCCGYTAARRRDVGFFHIAGGYAWRHRRICRRTDMGKAETATAYQSRQNNRGRRRVARRERPCRAHRLAVSTAQSIGARISDACPSYGGTRPVGGPL